MQKCNVSTAAPQRQLAADAEDACNVTAVTRKPSHHASNTATTGLIPAFMHSAASVTLSQKYILQQCVVQGAVVSRRRAPAGRHSTLFPLATKTPTEVHDPAAWSLIARCGRA